MDYKAKISEIIYSDALFYCILGFTLEWAMIFAFTNNFAASCIFGAVIAVLSYLIFKIGGKNG